MNKEENIIEFKKTDGQLGNSDYFETNDELADKLGDDFWNEGKPSTEAKDIIKEIKKDDNINNSENSKHKTDEELADEIFGKDDEFTTDSDLNEDNENDSEEHDENDLEEDSDNTESSTETKIPSIETVNYLKEQGMINFDLEEGEELTEELAKDILQDGLEEYTDNKIEKLFKKVPPIIKNLNKYVMNGGKVSEFFRLIKEQASLDINPELDLKKEENQELITKQILKQEGYDEDYIKAQIEFLRDNDKLEMFSRKKFDKWKADNNKKQEAIAEKQLENKKRQKENIRKYKNNLTNTINNSNQIGNIKLSRKDKTELPSYIIDKNIELENGQTISQRDRDLYEVLGDEKASIQLAWLLRNRNEDKSFNFKNIETMIKTKVAKEVKENVRRNKTNTPKKSTSKSRSSHKQRDLASFF